MATDADADQRQADHIQQSAAGIQIHTQVHGQDALIQARVLLNPEIGIYLGF